MVHPLHPPNLPHKLRKKLTEGASKKERELSGLDGSNDSVDTREEKNEWSYIVRHNVIERFPQQTNTG